MLGSRPSNRRLNKEQQGIDKINSRNSDGLGTKFCSLQINPTVQLILIATS